MRICQRRSLSVSPERAQAAQLILRQRLGRVEVERALLRLARDRVEHGQVERQRLPAGRAGRDDEVLAASRGVPGCALVRVELLYPLRRERVAHPLVQFVRKRREPGFTRRLGAEVGDLFALEEIVPGAGRDAHRRPRSATMWG